MDTLNTIMVIAFSARFGYYLNIVADNVKIEEDVESRIYTKDENGKILPDSNVIRDVKTSSIVMVERVLSDMIYYRKEEYDSTDLIKNLFDKLPSEKAKELAGMLYDEYFGTN